METERYSREQVRLMQDLSKNHGFAPLSIWTPVRTGPGTKHATTLSHDPCQCIKLYGHKRKAMA